MNLLTKWVDSWLYFYEEANFKILKFTVSMKTLHNAYVKSVNLLP